ncbi:MAG TPA: SAM-dependent chlorinase/fluorinase [Bacteroidia bacterium]|nr:SAM-dependent chlorinase/fluorinase [Bacteroidia bacterium]
MPIVTLTTDFGLKDHFAATLKGALYSAINGVTIADVSHLVTPFDIQQAAFTLGHSWHRFPRGTIHIVCVGPAPSQRFNHVAFRMGDHYFIGSNNGMFSLLSDDRPEVIVEICPAGKEPSSFPALDIYVPAAAAIASGKQLINTGTPLNGIAELIRPRHFPEDDVIKGNVVHIDSFGNLVTDIQRSEFERIGRGRPFSIQLIGDEITSIAQRYSDVDEGDKLALFNSEGTLEIAINQGKANQLLNLRMNSVVRINFNG